MVAFINEHRDEYGVEPICNVLPIAPSTYFEHHTRSQDPEKRPARTKRDETLRPEIARVWNENHLVYGPRRCGGNSAAKSSTWRGAPSSG
jgi:putative transposase